MRPRWGGACGLALVALLCVPASASATTRYVRTGGTDAPGCTSPSPGCSHIQYAIGQASSGDTIDIGPGTFGEVITTVQRVFLDGADGGTPGSPADPATDTIVKSPLTQAVQLGGGGGVSSIRLLGYDNLAAEDSEIGSGLVLHNQTAGDVSYTVQNAVIEGGGNNFHSKDGMEVSDLASPGLHIDVSVTGSYFTSPDNGDAIALEGANVSGSFTDTETQASPFGAGIEVNEGAANLLRFQTLDSPQPYYGALVRNDGHLTATRSTLIGRLAGLGLSGSQADLRDDLVAALPATEQINPVSAAIVGGYGDLSSTLSATGVTFVARGPEVAEALAVYGGLGGPPPGSGTANLTNSILRATDTSEPTGDVDVRVERPGGGGDAIFSAAASSYSDVLPVSTVSFTPPGSGSNITGDRLLRRRGEPRELRAAGLLGSGRPGRSLGRAERRLDLAGNPRSLDGNLDSVAVPDIGALESTGGCPSAGGGSSAADRQPPHLAVRAPKVERLRRLYVDVVSDEDATLVARGTILLRGHARVYRLKGTTIQVAANRKARLMLRLPPKAARAVKARLGGGQKGPGGGGVDRQGRRRQLRLCAQAAARASLSGRSRST